MCFSFYHHFPFKLSIISLRLDSLLAMAEELPTTWLLYKRNANNLIIWKLDQKIGRIYYTVDIIDHNRKTTYGIKYCPLRHTSVDGLVVIKFFSTTTFPTTCTTRILGFTTWTSCEYWTWMKAKRRADIARNVALQRNCLSYYATNSLLQERYVQRYENWCK